MFKKVFFALMLLPVSLSASAQNKSIKNQSVVTPLNIQQYIDSLRSYRERLDKAVAGNDSLRNVLELKSKSMEGYDLLSPLTFYRDKSGSIFGLDQNGNLYRTTVDKAMIRMYLEHPEFVQETEKELIDAGGIDIKQEAPVTQKVNFVEQEAVENAPVILSQPDEPFDIVTVKPNFWKYAGDYSLQFLQNYISSNWYKGGESSYAMIGAVALQANYNDKDKIKWDNKLEMKLGMQSSDGDTLHSYKSSEDLIRFTTKLGIQASKRWYYTLQGIAQTQFTHGYKKNDAFVYSDFMSPFTFNLSLGMDYKLEWFNKRFTGTVNISPIAGNYKYVDRLDLSKRNGIDEGKHSLLDYGSTFTADLQWKFSELIKWQTRLYAYTTYSRALVEWENTISFQLSKYISTKVFIYPRFDDSVSSRHADYGYFQLKEYWSLGFNYTF